MSTSATLNVVSPHQFADELYDWLTELDPALVTSAALERTSDRLEELRAQAIELQERWASAPPTDERLPELLAQLTQMLPEPASLSQLNGEWGSLHDSLSKMYEAIAQVLTEKGEQVRHLRPSNSFRSVMHLCAGITVAIIFELLLSPFTAVLAATAWCGWAWSLEVTRRYSERWNTFLMAIFGPFARDHERYRINSATWMGTALLILALTVPNFKGVLGLVAVAVGDPCAGYIGRRWGKHRIIRGRSVEGSSAFFISVVFVSVLWLQGFHSEIGWGATMALAATAAFSGMIAEMLSTKIDDNFAITIVTGWSAAVMGWFLGV